MEATRVVLEAELNAKKHRQHERFVAVAERAEQLETRTRRLLTDEDILDRFEDIARGEM